MGKKCRVWDGTAQGRGAGGGGAPTAGMILRMAAGHMRRKIRGIARDG